MGNILQNLEDCVQNTGPGKFTNLPQLKDKQAFENFLLKINPNRF